MKKKGFDFGIMAIASGLFALAPVVGAQQPSTPAPSAQGITEPAFVSHMRRNGEIESDLSKLEMKNGSNDAVKKLAKQVMSETRKADMILNGAVASNPNLGSLPYEQVPDVTRKAKNQMKSPGPQVDQTYIAQISAYIQDDQQTLDAASLSLKSTDLETTLPRLKEISDNQAKQISDVAQSENIKIQ